MTAGSSGGTAAAVAASLGAVGLGTDTGNSIRGPSSHTSLVGIRSTMGLTSRDGIVPLFLDKDIGGPMARTVADAVAVFDVIAGYDPADPVTAASQGKRADSYLRFLDRDGVRGTRIGVVRQLFTPQNTDPDVMKRMEQTLADLRRLGAAIVDPVTIAEIDSIPPPMLFCFRFKFDINEYLPRLAPDAQVKTLEDIIKSGKFHPSIEKRLIDRQAEPPLSANPRCDQVAQNTRQLRDAVQKVIEDNTLDAHDRRPQHAARQQQPAPVAADRLPRHHRADGIRTRHPAGRAPGARPCVERADADQDRLRIRTGDPPPPSAREHPAAAAAAVRGRPTHSGQRPANSARGPSRAATLLGNSTVIRPSPRIRPAIAPASGL